MKLETIRHKLIVFWPENKFKKGESTMNKFSKTIIFLMIVASLFLGACTQSLSKTPAPVVILPTVFLSTNTPAPATATVLPSPTFDALAGLVSTDTPVPAPVGECSLTDGTAQVQVEKVGNEWVVDPANLKVVAGYNNTQPGHDTSELSGCDMWVEYESPMAQEHILTVLRDDPTKPLAFLSEDGLFHIPSPKGGSFWVGPANWNTADLTTQKPSIVLEMAAAKQANQLRNGYDWPEVINLPDGSVVTYEVGHVYGGFYSGCKELETSPAPVNVAGTIIDGKFNASIGMEGCPIAVKLDGVWSFWHDARDNVEYATSAEAYLFKKGTTDEDVQKWIDSQQ